MEYKRKVKFKCNFRRVSAEENKAIRAKNTAEGKVTTTVGLTRHDVKEGLFHQWGLVSEEHEQNFCIDTVGIIEDYDGQMYSVNVNRIKFIN